MSRFIDRVGQKFGRLTVVEDAGRDKSKKALWLCLCDCGVETVVASSSLTTGNTKSCGCYFREVVGSTNITHGMTYSRLYNSWRGMKDRCLSSNSTNYPNYGGRGITICPEWFTFANFKDWAMANGYRPGLSVDRIDNDGSYEPGNCRWTARIEQNNNRRSSKLITFKGQTLTVAQWADVIGIGYTTLQGRLRNGWAPEQALNLSVGAIKTGPKPKGGALALERTNHA